MLKFEIKLIVQKDYQYNNFIFILRLITKQIFIMSQPKSKIEQIMMRARQKNSIQMDNKHELKINEMKINEMKINEMNKD